MDLIKPEVRETLPTRLPDKEISLSITKDRWNKVMLQFARHDGLFDQLGLEQGNRDLRIATIPYDIIQGRSCLESVAEFAREFSKYIWETDHDFVRICTGKHYAGGCNAPKYDKYWDIDLKQFREAYGEERMEVLLPSLILASRTVRKILPHVTQAKETQDGME